MYSDFERGQSYLKVSLMLLCCAIVLSIIAGWWFVLRPSVTVDTVFIPESVVVLTCSGGTHNAVRYQSVGSAKSRFRYQSMVSGNKLEFNDANCVTEIVEVLWDRQQDKQGLTVKASPAVGGTITF